MKANQILAAVLLTAAILPYFTSVAYGASLSTRFTPPGYVIVSKVIQTVPNTPTAIATSDMEIYQLTIGNITGSACTFTLADRATSAKTILATVSIAANTTYVIAWPEGIFMDEGATWTSGTASCLNASVKALRK
jgi:hypothetical protein